MKSSPPSVFRLIVATCLCIMSGSVVASDVHRSVSRYPEVVRTTPSVIGSAPDGSIAVIRLHLEGFASSDLLLLDDSGQVTGNVLAPSFSSGMASVHAGRDGHFRVVRVSGHMPTIVEAYAVDGTRIWQESTENRSAAGWEDMGLDQDDGYWILRARRPNSLPPEILRIHANGVQDFAVGVHPDARSASLSPEHRTAWTFAEDIDGLHLQRVQEGSLTSILLPRPGLWEPIQVTAVDAERAILAFAGRRGQGGVRFQVVELSGRVAFTYTAHDFDVPGPVLRSDDGSLVVGLHLRVSSTGSRTAVRKVSPRGELLWHRDLPEVSSGLPFVELDVVQGKGLLVTARSDDSQVIREIWSDSGETTSRLANVTYTERVARHSIRPDGVLAIDQDVVRHLAWDGASTTVANLGESELSKPFVYGMSIGSQGDAAVLLRAGQEDEMAWYLESRDHLGHARWDRIWSEPGTGPEHVEAGRDGPIMLWTAARGLDAVDRQSGSWLWDEGLALRRDTVSSFRDDGQFLLSGHGSEEGAGRGVFLVDPPSRAWSQIHTDNSLFPVAVMSTSGHLAARGFEDALHVFDPNGELQYELNLGNLGLDGMWVGALGPTGTAILRSGDPDRDTVMLDATGAIVSRGRGANLRSSDAPVAFDPHGTAWMLSSLGIDAAGTDSILVSRLSPAEARGIELAMFDLPARQVVGHLFLSDSSSILPNGDTVIVVTRIQCHAAVRWIDAQSGRLRDFRSLGSAHECTDSERWSITEQGLVGVMHVHGEDGQGELVQYLVPAQPRNSRIALSQRGISGAWYTPALSGQGVMLEYLPEHGTLFGAWFTYGSKPSNSAKDQRWYVLQGQVSDATDGADLDVYRFERGSFAAGDAIDGRQVGRARITLTSCSEGWLEWAFDEGAVEPELASRGAVGLERIAGLPNGCAQNEPLNDAPLTGSWFDPELGGQGVLLSSAEANHGALFGAWFTYRNAPVAGDDLAQSWMTLVQSEQAADGGAARFDIYATRGGAFGTVPTQNTFRIGELELRAIACDTADASWRFDDSPLAEDFAGTAGSARWTRASGCQ